MKAPAFDYIDYRDYIVFTIRPNWDRSDMPSRTWTVAEAKAKFSELIEQARARGPQTVTRNGRPAVVLVAAEEWERKTKRTGNLAEFFAASPLRGSGLVVERSKDKPRDIDL
jgi:prevent-host-death family protein